MPCQTAVRIYNGAVGGFVSLGGVYLEGDAISVRFQQSTVIDPVTGQQLAGQEGVYVFWELVHGTTSNADFGTRPPASVYVPPSTVAGPTISIPTVRECFGVEGDETFAIRVYALTSTGTYTLDQSDTITLRERSSLGEFVTQNPTVNEGQSYSYVVAFPGGCVSSGAVSLVGVSGGFSSGDATLASGFFTVSNGQTTITINIPSDALVEGPEVFRIRLTSGAATVAESYDITITDKTPSYAITPSATYVTEGSSVTFNVATTNVPDGTVLGWNVAGLVGATSADFASGTPITPSLGSVTVSGNTATITVSVVEDNVQESTEAFRVYLYSSAAFSTPALVQSVLVEIQQAGVCGQSYSGSNTAEKRRFTFPSAEAEITLSYNAGNAIADRYVVRDASGNTLLDTGYVIGTGSPTICKPAGQTDLIVEVIPDINPSTAWSYTLSCAGGPCNPLP